MREAGRQKRWTPNSISDLMALAIIRRLLLELGHPLQPERPETLIGPVELWVHEPRPSLTGRVHCKRWPARRASNGFASAS